MEKELTRAEEQIMEYLWELGEAFVKDIIEQMPEPKPAYTTVSTIIRILEKKGIVDHKAYGNTYSYFPLLSREQYTEYCATNLVKRHFADSLSNLVSFFTTKKNLSIAELEEIQKLIKDQVAKKKKS